MNQNKEYNYLTVGNKSNTQRNITTKHPFFKSELIIKSDEEKIVFTKPNLDYIGKTFTPFENKKTGFITTAIMCEIPLGKYDFDEEETNEDQIVVYYSKRPE